MKKLIFCLLVGFIMISSGPNRNTAHAADPVELKAVTAFPKNHPLVSPQGHEWIKMLNSALQGKAHIKYVGGPEAVPPRDQIEAVRNNIIQITMLPTAYYSSLVPTAATSVLVRFKDAMEMRNSGYNDFLVKQHEKIGVRYLGPVTWGSFYMWLKKPIKNLEELKGKKMRSFFLYDRFQKALGMTPVTIAVPELFTALERGVVQGFCFPLGGPRQQGWTKSTKYIIPYSFYALDVMFLMNLDTWKRLPKSAQDKIEEIAAKKYEPYMMDLVEGNDKKEWEALTKSGVKKISLSNAEAKKYVDTAYRVKWQELEEKIPADLISKLKKLTGN